MLLNTPKAKAAVVAGCLVLVALGYAAGRFSAPTKVQTTDKLVEISTDKQTSAVQTEKILAAIKELKIQLDVATSAVTELKVQVDLAKNVHVKRVVEKRPDGSSTTTTETTDTSQTKKVADSKEATTQDSHTTVDAKEATTQQEKKTEATSSEKTVYRDREITKLVERSRPIWGFTLAPGYDFAGALGHGQPINLIPASVLPLRHVVLGASIERRVAGPLSAGVWGNTQGSGGLILRLEF